MTVSSHPRMPTTHGSRHLRQSCKHWSHNPAVTSDETQGQVVFPRDARGADWPGDATVRFSAEADALRVEIAASVPEQRDGLEGAVARHLDRFAFREAPLAFDRRRDG